MKRPLFIATFLPIVWGTVAAVKAQETTSSTGKKALEQVTERLKEAQKSGELDRAASAAKDLLKKLPDNVKNSAQEAMQSGEAREKALEAAKKAALGEATLPKKETVRRAATSAPETPIPVPLPEAKRSTESPEAMHRSPMPVALTPLVPTPQNTTAVIEADDCDFDTKKGICIYRGNVKARHPDFYLECAELEVHLIMEDDALSPTKASGPAETKPAPPPAAAAGASAEKDPPVKKLTARGPMVIVEKRDPDGQIQQGRCRRLDYEKSTGLITLRDYPQVQRGNILQIATAADTYMTFDKAGNFDVQGRNRTIAIANKDQQPSR